MSHLAVAGLQLELGAGDNLEVIGREIDAAMARFPWLQMIVLPELCSFGAARDLALEDPGPTEAYYADLARRHGVWLIPGSLFYRQGESVWNVAPVIDPTGAVIARCRKRYPFRPFERDVAGGEAFTVVDLPGIGRIGVMICYDLWFPEMARQLAWMGAEALIVPSLTDTVDRNLEVAIARATAAINQTWMVNVNNAGRLGFGQSTVVGPDGTVIHTAGAGREVITVELDFEHARRVRERGLHGLCQTLKSFREGGVHYPVYQEGAGPGAFADLGPLEKPARDT